MLLDSTVLAESDDGKERRRFGTGAAKSAYRARYSTSEFMIAVILVFFYPALQKTGCSASIIPDPWEDLDISSGQTARALPD